MRVSIVNFNRWELHNRSCSFCSSGLENSSTMPKRKSKSRGAQSGQVAGVKNPNKPKVMKENPFEVRMNKRRYEVLGRKNKHERGKPGVSRSRGLKKVSKE